MSSIRTVHNADHESFQLWTTFWFLLYLLTPIFNILQIGTFSQILFVLWLSLPRFQGALWVYQHVFEPVMEKYSVEQKVDERMHQFWIHLKGIIGRMMMDMSGVILGQLGDLFSIQNQGNLNRNVERDATNKEDVPDSQKFETEKEKKTTEKTKVISWESKLSRKPSHSILDSLSFVSSSSSSTMIPSTTTTTTLSFSSSSSITDSSSGAHDIDLYRHDFLEILKQGLYVFAYDSRECRKRFRLRVFYYEIMDLKDDNIVNDHPKEYFVLETVDDVTDSIRIALDSIYNIEPSGLNGIQIMSRLSMAQENVITDIVLSDLQDQQTLLQGLKVCWDGDLQQTSSSGNESSECLLPIHGKTLLHEE